jgi:hypothetical protein
MDNLMEGIKENEVLTKILAAKITRVIGNLTEMKIDKFRLIIENLPNS